MYTGVEFPNESAARSTFATYVSSDKIAEIVNAYFGERAQAMVKRDQTNDLVLTCTKDLYPVAPAGVICVITLPEYTGYDRSDHTYNAFPGRAVILDDPSHRPILEQKLETEADVTAFLGTHYPRHTWTAVNSSYNINTVISRIVDLL
jgi:hypothetical protein